MSKTNFSYRTISLAFQVGYIARQVKDLIEVYVDRGYGSIDPLTIDDINGTPNGQVPLDINLTMEQFNEIAGFLVELNAFIDGGVVESKDRGIVLNKYRTDV